jgi:hypothetical protein
MEKIINITKFENPCSVEFLKEFTNRNDESFYNDSTHVSSWFGFIIETENKFIYLLIDANNQCCEDFGYFTTHDNLEDFIGSNLIKFEVSNPQSGIQMSFEYINNLDCEFINFFTDKGDFQLIVYNNHNGYYGHDIICEIKTK